MEGTNMEEPTMDEQDKKEPLGLGRTADRAADRADPADTGGWFFLKGKDTVDILRAFARWDAGSRVVGLVLLGVCAYYLRELVLAVLDLTVAMKTKGPL